MRLSYGQIAYQGYLKKSKGRSLVSGHKLPKWNQLDNAIKEAWEAAAAAVATAIISEI